MAHGMGKVVKDAETEVKVPALANTALGAHEELGRSLGCSRSTGAFQIA
jgi:hypothetical protein